MKLSLSKLCWCFETDSLVLGRTFKQIDIGDGEISSTKLLHFTWNLFEDVDDNLFAESEDLQDRVDCNNVLDDGLVLLANSSNISSGWFAWSHDWIDFLDTGLTNSSERTFDTLDSGLDSTDALEHGLDWTYALESGLDWTDALEFGLDWIDILESGLDWIDALESGLDWIDALESGLDWTVALEHGLEVVISSKLGSTPSYPISGRYVDNEDAGREMTDVAEHGLF